MLPFICRSSSNSLGFRRGDLRALGPDWQLCDNVLRVFGDKQVGSVTDIKPIKRQNTPTFQYGIQSRIGQWQGPFLKTVDCKPNKDMNSPHDYLEKPRDILGQKVGGGIVMGEFISFLVACFQKGPAIYYS